jgi:hypothetical protein
VDSLKPALTEYRDTHSMSAVAQEAGIQRASGWADFRIVAEVESRLKAALQSVLIRTA